MVLIVNAKVTVLPLLLQYVLAIFFFWSMYVNEWVSYECWDEGIHVFRTFTNHHGMGTSLHKFNTLSCVLCHVSIKKWRLY
jgi:hypothetical protein